MSNGIKRRQTMWAEMSPDLYDGPTCDQTRPRWIGHCEGSKGEVEYLETLELSARTFPPGTKVIVLEPDCPKCGQDVQSCRGDDGCDFNWDRWIEERYS